MSTLQPHPFADIFPPLPDEEFRALLADIRLHGQREPITLYEGKILDGCSRYACLGKLRRAPKTKTFRGSDADAVAYVVSVNVRRRHLDASQRAMVAAKLLILGVGRPKLAASGYLTQGGAAKAFGVGVTSVKAAHYVQKHGSPAEVRAVERGDATLKVIERALRASGGKADDSRDRDARQFQQYLHRLGPSASAFAEVARRVGKLAAELGVTVDECLDAGMLKAVREAGEAATALLGSRG